MSAVATVLESPRQVWLAANSKRFAVGLREIQYLGTTWEPGRCSRDTGRM